VLCRCRCSGRIADPARVGEGFAVAHALVRSSLTVVSSALETARSAPSFWGQTPDGV